MKPVIIIAIAFVLFIPVSAHATLSITADGGDCSQFGTWDSSSKTCTMNTNVNDDIEILANWITLDGNGNSITGTGVYRNVSGYNINSCIFLDTKIGVTITNLQILESCLHAVTIYESQDNVISNLQIFGTSGVAINLHNSDNNEVLNNVLTDVSAGMAIAGNGNIVEGNKFVGKGNIEYGGQGVAIGGNDNIFRNNEIM